MLNFAVSTNYLTASQTLQEWLCNRRLQCYQPISQLATCAEKTSSNWVGQISSTNHQSIPQWWEPILETWALPNVDKPYQTIETLHKLLDNTNIQGNISLYLFFILFFFFIMWQVLYILLGMIFFWLFWLWWKWLMLLLLFFLLLLLWFFF